MSEAQNVSPQLLKVNLDWDEWYPVYSIEKITEKTHVQEEIEVDADLLSRYEAALKEWEEVQDLLHELSPRMMKP